MTTRLNPYISFRDNARQAMEFYHGIFGGDLRMQTFKEVEGSDDPNDAELIMHAELDGDDGLVLMASDTPIRMALNPGNNVSMSLSGEHDSEERMVAIFEKLSDGGSVTMPMQTALWGDEYGMVTDKFGIHWLINISAQKM